jgi:XTP/dITP diphosphohydrolase
MKKLLVASTNKKKLAELQVLLNDLPLELIILSDIGKFTEVEETGKTFEENASLKALGYAKQTGFLTLGEDSGLSCDALEGAPGVYSARFSGPGKSDHENNLKLLKLLEKVPDNCREAHFTSAIAIAEPDKLIGVVRGEVHGFVSKELRGENGFGYDALFFYPPFAKNFGEVSSEMKHRVSHRAKALEKAKAILHRHLQAQLK